MKAIVVEQIGGPEALLVKDHPQPELKPGHALIKVMYAGINYIDTYHRTGLYKVPLPFVPGMEGSGVVEAVASDVTTCKPGDRVAWATGVGSYGEYHIVPAWQLVPLPENVDFATGAALMLQGMTAHYLVRSTYVLKEGDVALVHAAAGGVGLLLCQMASMLGARVIGTVGSEAKAELARKNGASEVIIYTSQDFVSEVKRLTDGKGVHVVYDSVGASTFEGSMQCLRPRGLMITFGNASGPVPAFEPLKLSQLGSLFITRPTLAHYVLTREELLSRAGELFRWLGDNTLKLHIEKIYKLDEAGQAHIDLQSRKTAGKLLLEVAIPPVQ
jgi:NADPH2:quinone reductase